MPIHSLRALLLVPLVFLGFAAPAPAQELAPMSRFARSLAFTCTATRPVECLDDAQGQAVMAWSAYAHVPIQLPLLGLDTDAWLQARRTAMAVGMARAFVFYGDLDDPRDHDIRSVARRMLWLDERYDQASYFSGSLVDVCMVSCEERDRQRRELLVLERRLRNLILARSGFLASTGAPRPVTATVPVSVPPAQPGRIPTTGVLGMGGSGD